MYAVSEREVLVGIAPDVEAERIDEYVFVAVGRPRRTAAPIRPC